MAQGNEAAFRQLYEAYQPRLSRYLSPFLAGRPYLVDEIVQDVFVKVWMRREMLEGISVFEYYLQRMARNRLIDLHKTAQIKLKHETGFAAASGGPQKETEDWIQLKEYHRLAQAAIQKMPERRRHLLRLSMAEGYTLEEIVELTGLSKDVVKKQLFKANRFIRDYLSKHGEIMLLILLMQFF